MHITASVFINDDEPGLHQDYKRWSRGSPPTTRAPSATSIVAVTKGKLDFGPWEQILYGEFDGRRPKKVLIKIIGD